MKKIIRKGTFETNSSSTHSLTIMEASKWKEFETTDKYLADWEGNLFLVEDLIEEHKDLAKKYPDSYHIENLEAREDWIKYFTKPNRWGCAEYFTHKTWGEYDIWSDWAEPFVEHFTTPSGDKMVAVGGYGYNG